MKDARKAKYVARAYFVNACGAKDFLELNWKGHATDKRAEKRRVEFNESLKPGGCNWHLSKSEGVLIHIFRFEVHPNVAGDTKRVAVAHAPLFEVA